MKDFSHPLFDGLPPEEALRLQGSLVHRHYEPEAVIVREGEQPDELLIIASGAVCVVCRDQHGRQGVIANLQAGQWFGEMSLITGEPASATVQAQGEVEVWALPRSVFAAVAEASPLLIERLSKVLVERLRDTNAKCLQAQKAEVSLFLAPGNPEWAKAVTRIVARSMAWHSRRRVVLVELSGNAEKGASPERGLRLVDTGYSGLSLVTLDVTPRTVSEVMSALESLRDSHDYALVYAGGDQMLGQAIAQSASRVLLLVSGGAVRAAADFAATLGLSDDGCSVCAIESTGRVSPLSIAECELLQKRMSVALRCFVPGGIDAVEALARDDGKTVAGMRAAREKLDWLARDIVHLKVGLALGGGGSRGYAHLGTLKVLQGLGVPVDAVAGCSIGATIGAGIAAGYSLQRIQAQMEAIGRKAVRLTLPMRSLLSNRGVMQGLKSIAGDWRFEDLAMPLGFVAVDVFGGEEVLLCRGSGCPAMLASMALPGIYPPVRIGERYLVDGGILNPVPVSAAVALGADVVVGVKLGVPQDQGEARRSNSAGRGPSILDTIAGTLETMQRKIVETSSVHADVTIEPEIPAGVSLLDFGHAAELMEAGERATEQALPDLRAAMPWLAR
ncbi:MAG: patatin-like phospholipase family protein [Dehalococcoidia bacterium]|jgi:NTE family protein